MGMTALLLTVTAESREAAILELEVGVAPSQASCTPLSMKSEVPEKCRYESNMV